MWSRNDQSSRRCENGKIFIKNLDCSIDNKAMYDTFSAFGNILSCRVATNEFGRSNGYGFVHFETEEAAKNAIWKVNGMLLNGKKVRIEKYVSRDERERELTENVKYFTNVYVKNFGTDLDDDTIGELFSKYGKITSRKVMTDENGKSRGFGFVNFQDPKSAEKAVEELNGTELNSKILYVRRAQNKAERKAELKHKTEQLELEKMNRYRGANLYVKNLDDSIDDERLRKEFARFGTITSVKVMVDKGRSRRFGFVCFTTPDEATRALMEMHGRILFSKPLYVAFAQRKEDRKAHLAYQHIQKVTEHRLQMGQLLPQGNSGYFIPTVPHVCNGCHCVPPQQLRSGGAIATAYPPPFMRTSQTTNQQPPMRTCVNSRPYARWQPVPAQDGSKCKSNSNVCIPSPAILFQTSSSTGYTF